MLRFYTFLASRMVGVAVALDIARQMSHLLARSLFMALILGMFYNNWKTLGKMRTNAKAAALGQPVSSWPL